VQIRALPTVQDDWRAWLPREKAQIFDEHVRQLESVYMMFSIALNEAIEFRQTHLAGSGRSPPELPQRSSTASPLAAKEQCDAAK